jgi:mono/diheme cytochrome c family protein
VGPSALSAQLRGHAFAQASCASCHAIGPDAPLSPNPRAPEFVNIVNRQGLTAETLSPWLKGAHNYPNEMAFQLDPSKVDDLVAYMLTLKSQEHRPPS